MNKKFLAFVGLFAIIFISTSTLAVTGDLVVSSYNYEPSPVEAGDTFELWVNVTNESSEGFTNINGFLDLEYPFSLPEGANPRVEIGSLKSQAAALVNFDYVKVDPSAKDGNYTIEFDVGPEVGTRRNFKLNIKVSQKKPELEIIGSKFEPESISPGLDNIALRLSLKNIGKTAAYDVRAIVGTSDSESSTSGYVKAVGNNVSYLGRIDPEKENQLEFKFAVDRTAELKTYLVPISIEFENLNGEKFSIDRTVGIPVTDVPQLDTVLVASDPLPVPGEESKISMDIFNAGGATANYVIAKVESEAFERVAPAKIFVGTLEPDDFDTFNFKAKFKAGITPGNYELKLILSYRDQGRLVELEPKIIQIPLYTSEEARKLGNKGDNTLLIVGVLVVLAIIFRKRILAFLPKHK